MPQPDGRCSHGNAATLFLGIAVEIAERPRESFADDTIGFDEVVRERCLAMIDVCDDCDEASGFGRWQHFVI